MSPARFGLVWALEWRIALRRRRLFLLNVTIPLLLVVPVAVSGAPAAHASAAYAVLFVLFGTFGAAIPLIRDGGSGLLSRIRSTGLPPATILLERTAAGAAVDAVQLTPALACVVGLGRGGAESGALAAAAVAASLLLANLVGAWVAALARSVAEGALFAAVSALLLLHASGVFRTPEPGSPGAVLEAGAPLRLLHESLLSVVGGTQPAGAGTAVLSLALALAALAALTAASADRALETLSVASEA